MMNSYRKTHYTLRHRMIATLSQRLDGITYTQRHGLIRGMKRQGGLGFLPAILAGGDHETAEHRFLRSLDLRNKVVYEVGAFRINFAYPLLPWTGVMLLGFGAAGPP